MHPLVQVGLLGVDVAVEVDDADVAVHVRGKAADGGKADGVVPAEHDRHDALLRDVRHGLADLVERLLQIARNGEHVTDVDDVELLAQIDAGFVVVGAEQVGRAPNSLRSEPGAGPVGGARIQRNAEDGDLGVVDLVDVLDERTLQERAAFAREVRLLAADEGRDGSVVDGGRGLEAEAQTALDLLAQPAIAEVRLGLLSPGAFGIERLVVVGHGCSSRAVLSLAGYDAPRPGSPWGSWVLILAAIGHPATRETQRRVNTARKPP